MSRNSRALTRSFAQMSIETQSATPTPSTANTCPPPPPPKSSRPRLTADGIQYPARRRIDFN